ncbi:ATP synthase subunit b [uncultured archaeon]|nr:ATP synthase subunit b [uncultured archaeon]
MVQIDYFTLTAQIINFLVLVLLLRHFLYKRIIKAMDEREAIIASRLKESEQKKEEAVSEAESYRKKQQELQDKKEEMLAQVREEVEALRKDLIQKARGEVLESKAKWFEALQHEKESVLADLRRRTGEEVYTIARRALKDLADEELEQHIINTFIKRLRSLDEKEKNAISGLSRQQQEIVIRSTFEIPQKMRQSIQETLQGKTGGTGIRFMTSPDLVCGIELDAGGMRIKWSLGSYLDALEEDISRELEQRAAEGVKVENEKRTG